MLVLRCTIVEPCSTCPLLHLPLVFIAVAQVVPLVSLVLDWHNAFANLDRPSGLLYNATGVGVCVVL